MATQATRVALVESLPINTSQPTLTEQTISILGPQQAPPQATSDLGSDYAEIVEVEETYSNVNVKGRLKDHIQFWRNIQAPDYIIDIIDSGYKIPFQTTPYMSFSKNNASTLKHSEFVCESIEELLASGRITQQPSKDTLKVVNPLSVSVQSTGKMRLILDLRFVNQFVMKQKFKLEDHKKALEYFTLGGFWTKFDLKSGYHHIDVFPAHQTFLGFSWTFPGGVRRYFAYTVLPFGLTSAPWVFTKVLRSLVKYWRSRDLYIVLYLDDGFSLQCSL